MRNCEELSRKYFDEKARRCRNNPSLCSTRFGKISCNDIASRLSGLSYSNLLDVGSGSGYLLDILSRQKKASYYGMDISDEMTNLANSMNISDSVFFTASAESIPFADDSFDVVTCSQCFHHFPYQLEAMKEAYRVLRKGGLFILSDVGVGGIGAILDNHVLFPILSTGDYHVTNRNGIANMMKKAHFSIREKSQVKGFVYTVVAVK